MVLLLHLPRVRYSVLRPIIFGRGLWRQVLGSYVIWFRAEADLLRVMRVMH